MAKGSGAKHSLEEEVKTLQKHMGAVMRTVKDLKVTVEALEKKSISKEDKEIKEIIETQKEIEEVLAANSEAIKRIDREIAKRQNTETVNIAASVTPKEAVDNARKDVVNVGQMTKKCRYFNIGYCKYNKKCRFYHPEHICEDYLKYNGCENKECNKRHPRKCKWEGNRGGCRRHGDCDYLHFTNDNMESSEDTADICEYQCVSCKSIWNDKIHLVEHSVKNMKLFFCLNCSDWVRNKDAVLDQGWTLLDEAGYLRQNI